MSDHIGREPAPTPPCLQEQAFDLSYGLFQSVSLSLGFQKWTEPRYQLLWIAGLQTASHRDCQAIWSPGPITLIRLLSDIVVVTFLIAVT